jgi:hypothetical protein
LNWHVTWLSLSALAVLYPAPRHEAQAPRLQKAQRDICSNKNVYIELQVWQS